MSVWFERWGQSEWEVERPDWWHWNAEECVLDKSPVSSLPSSPTRAGGKVGTHIT